MLTTLAIQHYRGEESIAEGFVSILAAILEQIADATPGRIAVPNPTDELAPHYGGIEDFASPLTDDAYQKFSDMVEDANELMSSAATTQGTPKLTAILGRGFGPQAVRHAFNAVDDEVTRANTSGLLGVGRSTNSIYVLSSSKVTLQARPIKGSSFHLDV